MTAASLEILLAIPIEAFKNSSRFHDLFSHGHFCFTGLRWCWLLPLPPTQAVPEPRHPSFPQPRLLPKTSLSLLISALGAQVSCPTSASFFPGSLGSQCTSSSTSSVLSKLVHTSWIMFPATLSLPQRGSWLREPVSTSSFERESRVCTKAQKTVLMGTGACDLTALASGFCVVKQGEENALCFLSETSRPLMIYSLPVFQLSLKSSHPGHSVPCANSACSSLVPALNPLLGTFSPQFLACIISSCHSGHSSKGTFQWPSQATHSFLKVISYPGSVWLSSEPLTLLQSVCLLSPCLPLPRCELSESRGLVLVHRCVFST